ncbi:MAG: hypothetical protein K2M89_05845 [Clostridiales bacterium]|nr:hypothetical protein [Clostridiales bacterium]
MSDKEKSCGGNYLDKMNRCIHCVHYKRLFIRLSGRYKVFPNDGFCALKKVVISKDGFCEAWQKRKIDQDLYEKMNISVLEDCGFFVMNFDELL